MGFHGYGHTSCIIGEFSIADCPEGPQIHCHSLDSASSSHECHRRHPNRTIVPWHCNDGPVDLSQYCTPTGRGTWSIGGQGVSAQSPESLQNHKTLSRQVIRIPSIVANAVGDTMHTMHDHENFGEREASFAKPQLCRSPPIVDIPKVRLENDDAKNRRSQNDDIWEVKMERNFTLLLRALTAATSPLSICHEQFHNPVNAASIFKKQEALTCYPTTRLPRRTSSHRESVHGLDAYEDMICPADLCRPGTGNTSSTQSISTAFSWNQGGTTNQELSSLSNSCCENDSDIQEDG